MYRGRFNPPERCRDHGTSTNSPILCGDCGEYLGKGCPHCVGTILCNSCELENERAHAGSYAAAEMGYDDNPYRRNSSWRFNCCGACNAPPRQNRLRPSEAEAILDRYLPNWRSEEPKRLRLAARRKYNPDVDPAALPIIQEINDAIDVVTGPRREEDWAASGSSAPPPPSRPVPHNYKDSPRPIASTWFNQSRNIFFLVFDRKRRGKNIGLFLTADNHGNVSNPMPVIMGRPLPPDGSFIEIHWTGLPHHTQDQVLAITNDLLPQRRKRRVVAKPKRAKAPPKKRKTTRRRY